MATRATILMLAGLMLAGVGVASAQGLSVTRITAPQAAAGLGALLGLAQGLGAETPAEVRERIAVSADGNRKRIDTGDQTTIYLLDSREIITINESEMTWSRQSFDQYQEQFRAITGDAGRATGADFDPSDLSFDMSVEAQGDREVVHGFDAELFHQVMSMEMSGETQRNARDLPMDGTFHAASRIWAADKDDLDLGPLNDFNQRLAEELVLGGGGATGFSSMINSPQVRQSMTEFQEATAELRTKEPVSTLTRLFLVPRGQDFDADSAFRESETAEAPETGGGGGGLFGGLRGLTGALGRRGGDSQAGGAGQMELGGVLMEYVDYSDTSPAASLFSAPGASYRETSNR